MPMRVGQVTGRVPFAGYKLHNKMVTVYLWPLEAVCSSEMSVCSCMEFFFAVVGFRDEGCVQGGVDSRIISVTSN